MLFKSGFFKTASYQRFKIVPRYYDPVKEDIEQRTERIKAEMGLSEKQIDIGYRSQIAGSFKKNSKHAPKQGGYSVAVIRLIIMFVLVMLMGGFIYIGPDIFYLLLMYVPFYLWKRFRR